MTRDEFIEWVRYHDAAFPGYRQWANQSFRDAKDQSNEDREHLKNRIDIWLQRFEQIPLPFASQCTEQLYKDDFDQPFGKHSGWIYELWKASRQANHFGKVCGLCRNTGIVSVVFKEPMLTYGGHPLPDNQGQAACKCSVGTYINECRRNSKDPSEPNRPPHRKMLPEFNLAEMDVWRQPKLTPVKREEIRQRMSEGRDAKGNSLMRLFRKLEGLGL